MKLNKLLLLTLIDKAKSLLIFGQIIFKSATVRIRPSKQNCCSEFAYIYGKWWFCNFFFEISSLARSTHTAVIWREKFENYFHFHFYCHRSSGRSAGWKFSRKSSMFNINLHLFDIGIHGQDTLHNTLYALQWTFNRTANEPLKNP